MLKKILNKLVIKRKPVRIPTNYSPNILLTSYCNQNCSFCFASHLMGKRNKTNHISFEKYAKLLDYLEKNGINEVFLMGGEPTMHPDFIKIIRETVDRGFAIELFTNGVFSDEIRDFLISLGNQIKMYHLNLAAPIYGKSNVAKKKLAEFVRVVKNFSDISLTLTIDSFEQNYLKQVLSIGLNNLKNCSVRIGVAGLFTWKDGFSLKKNKEIGKMIVSMSCELLSKRHVKSVYLTEITRCMFEDDEWKNIEKMKNQKKIKFLGFGCKGKRASMELKSNFRGIRCYGLSGLGEISIMSGMLEGRVKGKNSLINVADELDRRRIEHTKKILPLECRLCKYHGYDGGEMCPGPCLIKEKS